MLDAFIVEWLRRERQRQEQRRHLPEQPQVEWPLQDPEGFPPENNEEPEGSEDVVIVVNL